jgi:hypothetical protein
MAAESASDAGYDPGRRDSGTVFLYLKRDY